MITARKTFLPFALPSISEDAIEEVASVLRSGWVTSGPKVKQFEMEFGDFVTAKESIAVNSATAGLHLALEAIGLKENDAVFAPAVTFTATTEVICYFNAEPVITDVDPVNNLMTPATLMETIERECKVNGKELIHKKTKKILRAIIPVHLAGHTCDLEGILEIAKRYNLYVIEDAAHAFPAVHKNKMIGTFSDFTVFSFYATKGITTGEGGMITTNNKEFADRMKVMRLHGINRDAYNRPGWYYEVIDAGFKYNMTDVAAALGVVQLREAHAFWNRRTQIAIQYRNEFSNIKGIRLPEPDSSGIHSWHLFRMEIDTKTAKIGRDTFVEEMRDRNIGTSLHFIPIYEHPFYKKKFGYEKKNYPNSAVMYDRTVSIPLFAGMTDADVKDVVNAVHELLD